MIVHCAMCIVYTGIGRKNYTEFDIFITITNHLGHPKSIFFLFKQADPNSKHASYLETRLGMSLTDLKKEIYKW